MNKFGVFSATTGDFLGIKVRLAESLNNDGSVAKVCESLVRLTGEVPKVCFGVANVAGRKFFYCARSSRCTAHVHITCTCHRPWRSSSVTGAQRSPRDVAFVMQPSVAAPPFTLVNKRAGAIAERHGCVSCLPHCKPLSPEPRKMIHGKPTRYGGRPTR